jgi:hypothetical protein
VENSFIKNMPMESDRAGALVRLLPGVTFQQEETFEPQLDFSLAGGPSRSNEYRLDGGSVTLIAICIKNATINAKKGAIRIAGCSFVVSLARLESGRWNG